MLQVAVIGAGWAGLSAAVRTVQAGHAVRLFEMSHHPGGRAQSLASEHGGLDNGQHILIGAYRETLSLMRAVGVDPDRVLWRSPLVLRYPDGSGLALPDGHPALAFARAVLGATHWSLRDRALLLARALRWRVTGFRCDPLATVATLCAGLPDAVLRDLIDPLCVAALNTPVDQASGQVFLRVLADALFAGPGSADLLLPRVPLSQLLPAPAIAWLQAQGASFTWGHQVKRLTRNESRQGPRWAVDTVAFDAVIVATSAKEGARLIAPIDPVWSQIASNLRYEPIVTVWLRGDGPGWPQPMLALRAYADAPAQFAFDLGQLGGPPGLHTFVVSGAAGWLAQGLAATAQAVLSQARRSFPGRFDSPQALQTQRAERRATFACVPGLQRPPGHIAQGLAAAGDHVAGPYPATLEGAVRSGAAAAHAVLAA